MSALPPAATAVTRRRFLEGFAGFQLGLALGPAEGLERFHVLRGDGEASPDQLPGGELPAVGAWVRIAADGQVTVLVAKSEMGQGVRTSLAMIVAEELDADWSKVVVRQAPTDPATFGSFGTVGSSSVSGSFQNLRRAGAAARAMLVQAAAQAWGVGAEGLRTEAGAVLDASGARRATYGELAAAAARLAPPSPNNVPLKATGDFRIIGQPTRRVDGPDIVTGRARYASDVRLPGMLFAVVARCPVFGGRAARHDEAAAMAVPGVRRVLPIQTGIAVVADTTWAAIQGREALAVTWNEGANAALDDAAVRAALEQAATAWPGWPGGAAGLREVEPRYDLPYLAHATMEPMCCVADVRADRAEIWAPSQGPDSLRRSAAGMLGLPESAVTLHVPLLGGGFGRRAGQDYATEAVTISRAAGAPVLVTWTRDDDLQHDYYRPASHHRLRAALAEGGRPAAWQQRGGMAGGGASEGQLRPPYDIPAFDLALGSARLAVPTGAWRSVIHSASVFANECFVDELAHAAGADPVAYRRGLIGSRRLQAVLDRAAAEVGWGEALPAGRGRGIACASIFGSHVATAAELSVDAAGKVTLHRVEVAVDCGLAVNPLGVESQVQGAVVDGLSTAFKAAISLKDGRVQESSFFDYEWFRLADTPPIRVHLIAGGTSPGGVGEVGYPTTAPAVANAVFAATGRRLRRLPMRQSDLAGAVTPGPTPTATTPPTTEPTPLPTQLPATPEPIQNRVYLPRAER